MLPGLLFALWAKLELERLHLYIADAQYLVFKIQTHAMALSQKLAGYTGIWHFLNIGMRVVAVVNNLVQFFFVVCLKIILKLEKKKKRKKLLGLRKFVPGERVSTRRQLQNCESSCKARK